jgi:hypothetical protein
MRLSRLFTIFSLLAAVGFTPQVLKSQSINEQVSEDAVTSSVLDEIDVLHIHQSGWASHVVHLIVRRGSLQIRGNASLSLGEGVSTYCTFPADVPFDQIVKIEVNRDRADFLGFEKITKLNIEVKDERGKHHIYHFLAIDAVQDNNEWHEGVQAADDMRRFAQTAQDAIKMGKEALKYPALYAPSGSSSETTSGIDDDRAVHTSSQAALPTSSAIEVAHETSFEAFHTSYFNAQIIGTIRLFGVTVGNFGKRDSGALFIRWNESGGNNVVSLDDVLDVDIKQRPTSLVPVPPGTLFAIHEPVLNGAKVYVLRLKVRSGNGKKFTYSFVSDEATCTTTEPCQDGNDAGQHVLDLARVIKETITKHEAAKHGSGH